MKYYEWTAVESERFEQIPSTSFSFQDNRPHRVASRYFRTFLKRELSLKYPYEGILPIRDEAKRQRLDRQRREDWDCSIPPPSFSFHSPISSHNDRGPGADITTCRQCVIMLAFHFRSSTVSWKPCLSSTVSTTGWTLSHCIVERKVAKMTTMITELLENSRYAWFIDSFFFFFDNPSLQSARFQPSPISESR